MLRTLRVRQLVIIEDLTVEFGPGLNLLTGETGAGKSILVDALGLVAGRRADREMVRSGAEAIVVEALFDLGDRDALASWAREHGFDGIVEDGECLIRREVPAAGAGRVLVNGAPCTVGLLRELTGRLLELHGQHDQRSLVRPERHLELMDRFGEHGSSLDAVAEAHDALAGARRELRQLEGSAAERERRLGELDEAIGEIDAVEPRPGELAELARERALLENAERVRTLLDELVARAYDDEPSAASLAAAAARRARELAAIDPGLGELAERMETAAVELQDAGASFRDYRDRADFDPGRLEQLQEREVALERLLLHHGADEQEVLDRRDELRAERARLAGGDGALAEARERLGQAESHYVARAAELSAARREAAGRLVPAVEAQLAGLAMPKARLDVAFVPSSTDVVGRSVPVSRHGAEGAELQLAANAGEPPRALGRVASGGELSRVMLAIHAAVDDTGEARSLVFDEIDAGVGGAVADAVGARLAGLARRHQVLCVTHLPQVAAYADRHYHVRKQVQGRRTRAEIASLAAAERVDELARMLAGRKPTAASRTHAAELLDSAARLQQGRRA